MRNVANQCVEDMGQLDMIPVYTVSGQVSAVPTPTDIHLDNDIALPAGHVTQPVHLPLVVHNLATRSTITNKIDIDRVKIVLFVQFLFEMK